MKKIKCDVCLKYNDERVIYRYIVGEFIMLENVCLACLFQVKKVKGLINTTPIIKIDFKNQNKGGVRGRNAPHRKDASLI